MTQQRKTVTGLELLKHLSRAGYRIFDIETARKYAPQANISDSYLRQALTLLKKNNWIIPLRNGLYGMDISFLGGVPLHEHEIAMFLVNPAAVSYLSAFQYHGLTDQIPYVVYIKTKSEVTLPILSHKTLQGYIINGVAYKFTKVSSEHYFGFTERWEGTSKIIYTDFERTLLDGLSHPQFCGGIQEVLNAFQKHLHRINVQQLINYGLKLDNSIGKRLGWVLSKLGIRDEITQPLLEVKVNSYYLINCHGKNFGSYCRKWMIRENI